MHLAEADEPGTVRHTEVEPGGPAAQAAGFFTMKENEPVVDQFCDWLLTAGLYRPKTFTTAEAARLAEWISPFGLQLDCYCPTCKRTSTFTFQSTFRLRPPIPATLDVPGRESMHTRVEEYLPREISGMGFTCARGGNAHPLQFYIMANANEDEQTFVVTKVGQIPSQMALASADLQRYAKLLDDEDMRELKSAEVCHSAGYHIAAFTYLRRVFERRIDVAHAVASKDAGWKEPAYAKLFFMEQKIDALRAHLPTFLVEHRKVYNILSAGIHELTEKQCSDGYATVRLGITLILDEEIERRERTAKIAKAGVSLQKLQEKYEGK